VTPTTPADEDIAERLRQSIGRFVRATRAHADTLSPTRAAVLGILWREGSRTIAQLAAGRGVRHQSMSRLVGELEALGLVARQADPGDGRAFLITLTVDGTAALDADRLARRRWMAHAIATRLSPAEREMLNAVPTLLDRLSEADAGPAGARPWSPAVEPGRRARS
jgi:DNA-binding MarR family transcriptional regulator